MKPSRVFPDLNADIFDAAVRRCRELPLGSRRNTQPVSGGEGHGLPIDGNGPPAGEDAVYFLVLPMGMDKRHPSPGGQPVNADLCAGQAQAVVEFYPALAAGIDFS